MALAGQLPAFSGRAQLRGRGGRARSRPRRHRAEAEAFAAGLRRRARGRLGWGQGVAAARPAVWVEGVEEEPTLGERGQGVSAPYCVGIAFA